MKIISIFSIKMALHTQGIGVGPGSVNVQVGKAPSGDFFCSCKTSAYTGIQIKEALLKKGFEVEKKKWIEVGGVSIGNPGSIYVVSLIELNIESWPASAGYHCYYKSGTFYSNKGEDKKEFKKRIMEEITSGHCQIKDKKRKVTSKSKDLLEVHKEIREEIYGKKREEKYLISITIWKEIATLQEDESNGIINKWDIVLINDWQDGKPIEEIKIGNAVQWLSNHGHMAIGSMIVPLTPALINQFKDRK
jgi:hypothetical protein